MSRISNFSTRKHLRIITYFLLLVFTLIACSQKPVTPSGEIVKWEDVGDLYARSYSQMETRKNDIELSIKISKSKIKMGDTFDVAVVLRNKTEADIVVYRMDTMPVFEDSNIWASAIEFILISKDTNERVGPKSFLGFPQLADPSPQDFSILFANNSLTSKFSLANVLPSIPVGDYSIQMVYKNESDFGAVVNTESEYYFIDYDAWIGTALSNIESFQIAP